MSIDVLINYINNGREIEFEYGGKRFSITYGEVRGRDVISFCEFYKESIEVDTVDELFNIPIYGKKLSDIWESLTEENVWIF